jgi:hypothetical protein
MSLAKGQQLNGYIKCRQCQRQTDVVIAITTAAIIQPFAIHRPPKMIHSRFKFPSRHRPVEPGDPVIADMGLQPPACAGNLHANCRLGATLNVMAMNRSLASRILVRPMTTMPSQAYPYLPQATIVTG